MKRLARGTDMKNRTVRIFGVLGFAFDGNNMGSGCQADFAYTILGSVS